jgi:peptide/nickel transport system substrate-binding protein
VYVKRTISALLCALLLTACSKVAPATQPATSGAPTLHSWSHPGQLRIAVQAEPNSLNPILSANTTEGLINRLSFDVLVTVDSTGKNFVPSLASEVPTTTNGGISKDGLTITYKLRSGVKWQDGVPFTSKDVKFSWQAMMNTNNNVNSRVGYDDVTSVDTPNATTVVFHLKKKFAPFVGTVFSESDGPVCIIPEHLLAKFPDLNRVAFNQMPIGTGPFKVVKWARADRIEFVANPNYFKGVPKLKTVAVRFIPDENTEINSLRTHDIDWMFEPSPNLYLILKDIEKSGDIIIHFNDTPQVLNLLMNTSHKPLDDLRVRRAIAYAIDKQALVDKFTGGSAHIGGSDQAPFSWAYEPNIMRYPPDVAKAKALLLEAGYTPGPDGMVSKNGQPLVLQISTNISNVTRKLIQTQVQGMLKVIGIDVSVKNYAGNLFFGTYGQGGIQATGKFDLSVSGWIAGIDPDDHSQFASGEIPRPGHPDGVNYTHYNSKAMDAAQIDAQASYDQAVRKVAYSKIQKLIAQDVPQIVIWYPRFPQSTNPDFKGFAPNPVSEAWNAYQWEI